MVFKNLLDMHVDLAQDRRRDGVAVAFVGQHRHAALDAERLEDGFGDAKRQAVERPDEDDAVVALAFRPHAIAHGGNDLAVDRR